MKKTTLFSLIVLLISSLSCKQDKWDKNIEVNKSTFSDTIFEKYNNGKVKAKGLFKKGNKVGWWLYFDSFGKLIKKEEFMTIDSKPHINQFITYNNKGKIDYDNSWFFEVKFPDTISLGRNMGEVNYFSNKKADQRYLSAILDNEYSKGVIKKDTFLENHNYTWFGVYAYKLGVQKVRIRLVEELLISGIEDGEENSYLHHNYHSKYIERDVYVKDSVASKTKIKGFND